MTAPPSADAGGRQFSFTFLLSLRTQNIVPVDAREPSARRGLEDAATPFLFLFRVLDHSHGFFYLVKGVTGGADVIVPFPDGLFLRLRPGVIGK